jgi:hypothetical protein
VNKTFIMILLDGGGFNITSYKEKIMSIDFNGLSVWTIKAHMKNLIEMEEQRIREDNEAHPKGRQLELDESQAYLTALRFVESMATAVSVSGSYLLLWDVVKERRLKQYDLEHGRRTHLYRDRIFYRHKESAMARRLEDCGMSEGFVMEIYLDRRAECQCCGTDLKLVGSFDQEGRALSAGISFKESHDSQEHHYNPPEWKHIDWRATDYRMKNPDVLLDGAIDGLMKHFMTDLYRSDDENRGDNYDHDYEYKEEEG